MNIYLLLHPFLKLTRLPCQVFSMVFTATGFQKDRYFTCIIHVRSALGAVMAFWHNDDWKLPGKQFPATAPVDQLACTLCLMMIKHPISALHEALLRPCALLQCFKQGVCTSGY